MKTLGLIGGTSWHSTIEYNRLINEQVGAKIGRQVIPCLSFISINIEIMREQNLPTTELHVNMAVDFILGQ
jgi:aspartate racemase